MAFYIKWMWLIEHVHAEMILCFEIYCSYCKISKGANIFYPAQGVNVVIYVKIYWYVIKF